MSIRLEIDGEVVKSLFMEQPYTFEQRKDVVSFLQSIADSRDYKDAWIVLSPLYEHKREQVLPTPVKVKTPKKTRNDIPILDFVKSELKLCALALPDFDKRRGELSARNGIGLQLVERARKMLEYSDNTCNSDILLRVMLSYKKHMNGQSE